MPGTQQLSQGFFWFLIAITLFLALLDERVRAGSFLPVTAGWMGIFVLYYGLRSSLKGPSWDFLRCLWPWRQHWWSALQPQLMVDLVVISALLALTGGWASPLYMLYLGWAAALMEASALSCLYLTAAAGGAFVVGCLLALRLPLSPLQTTMIAEHLLLLLLISLGIGIIRAYITYLGCVWEAEHRQWNMLRQALFAQLSHELYTPISAISTSAALLSEPGIVLQAEQQRYLTQVIQRNCTRLNVLIDDLLAMWRKQQQQPDSIPVSVRCLDVAELVAQTLRPLLDARQQRLVILVGQPDICALVDPRRLEQVLVNLLANAQKYAPAGTAITLTITAQRYEALFAIHDEGAGVAFEEQSRLFELFYRGANCPSSSRGSGIGLALAKALVLAEGGHIWVESAPGKGSTFYFTLPCGGLE